MKLQTKILYSWLAKLLLVILLLNAVLLNHSLVAKAASANFSLSPSSGSVNVGDTLTASVIISTDTPINAGEGSVIYPSDTLEFQSASGSGSIFSFWTNGPSGGATSAVFGGGLPSPGYNGGGGRVMTIVWKAKSVGSATVSIIGNKILANDGVGTNILSSSGGGSFTINVPGTPTTKKTEKAKLVMSISSTSHPDQEKWFSNKNVALAWTANEAKSYLIAFDQSAETVPKEQTTATSKTYENNADGVWYFHAQAKGDSGVGTVAHFKAQVDTTPPEPFSVIINQDFGAFDPSPTVTFEAKDATSGIDHYEAMIDGGQPFAIKSGDNLPKQKQGDHTLIVKAFDKAGNIRESKADLKIGAITVVGIKLFGHYIPFMYIIYFLLLILLILLILDFYLWGKMRRLMRRGAGAIGVAYNQIRQIFWRTEKDIDKEIDGTIPSAELSKGVVLAVKKDLKEKVHDVIEKEEEEAKSTGQNQGNPSIPPVELADKVKKENVLSEAEREINQEIDETITDSGVSRSGAESTRENLKKRVHETIVEEENDINKKQ